MGLLMTPPHDLASRVLEPLPDGGGITPPQPSGPFLKRCDWCGEKVSPENCFATFRWLTEKDPYAARGALFCDLCGKRVK